MTSISQLATPYPNELKFKEAQMPSLPALISAPDAIALSRDPEQKIVFIDATFLLPQMGRDAEAEYLEAHIQDAIRFNLDEQSDAASPFPHTTPSPDIFEMNMRKLGLNQNDHILIYDNSPFLSGARAWFMFRHYGHSNVSILDGGLAAWRAAGGAIASQHEQGSETRPMGDFKIGPPVAGAIFKSLTDVQNMIGDTDMQMIDARGPARFRGEEPEPRAGMAAGHIPGSVNLPVTALLDADTGRMRPMSDIRALFDTIQIDLNRPIVTTCGSGVTACGLAFALHLCGTDQVSVYDGSWSQWGHESQDRNACPIAN